MAANMGLIVKKCFPNATCDTDRFHVQNLASEAMHEIRIKYRWQGQRESSYRKGQEKQEKI